MYSAIVYDLDGTLVDSAPTVAALLNELRAERSLPPMSQDAYKPWLSTGGTPMVAAALGISQAQAEPLLQQFRARYLHHPTRLDSVFPAVHNTLKQLRHAGIAMALCTNKPRRLVEKVLLETGLEPFFDAICAGDDLPTKKPHPNNLMACMKSLGSQNANTLLIGDSRVDQCLAQACNTDFAFFAGGYDDGVNHNSYTMRIEHHPEVLSFLKIIKERSTCEQL